MNGLGSGGDMEEEWWKWKDGVWIVRESTAQGSLMVYISAMDECMEECLEWVNFWHKGLISVVNGLCMNECE